MFDLDRSVEVPGDVLVRIIDGEGVLLNLDDETYYALDGMGTHFWQAITDTPTCRAAVDLLATRFDVDVDRLTADFADFVTELIATNLVQLKDSAVTVE